MAPSSDHPGMQMKEAKIDALQAVEEKESEISRLQDKLEAAEKSRNNINTEVITSRSPRPL